jgi:N-formylglutamate deformylase
MPVASVPSESPFRVVAPQGRVRPVVVSVPHCGLELPGDVAARLDPALARALPDTDFFVDELYGFAPALGVTLISARFSRYVVDLNRDPSGARLYTDGRKETALVPTTSFAGGPLYVGAMPTEAEVDARVARYFEPYHAQVDALVAELRRTFRHVLFWDAHSIKRLVPTIRPEPFPDMILGDQRGKTAAAALSTAAADGLGASGLRLARNDPFMGGYLTRRVGRPESGVHALQLEMSQDVYMDAERDRRDPARQGRVATMLAGVLARLADVVEQLP